MYPLLSKTIISLLTMAVVALGHHTSISPVTNHAAPDRVLATQGAQPASAAAAPEAAPAAAAPPAPAAAPSAPAAAQQSNEIAPSKKFALIIGIVYNSDDLGTVHYADQDAGSVYSMLINKMGFLPQNILYLKDERATRENIMNSLGWLATNPNIDSSSEVVVFYSGHGVKNVPGAIVDNPQLGPGTALVPYDYHNYDYQRGAGLIWDKDLAAKLGNLRPARMWVNIDSCFSAGFLIPGITGPNRVVVASSGADQLSNEIPLVQGGVETHFLVNEAMDQLGMPVEQAFWYAYTRSQNYSQSPEIADNYPGNLDLR